MDLIKKKQFNYKKYIYFIINIFINIKFINYYYCDYLDFLLHHLTMFLNNIAIYLHLLKISK